MIASKRRDSRGANFEESLARRNRYPVILLFPSRRRGRFAVAMLPLVSGRLPVGVHRIRLTAAWKRLDETGTVWERVFHAPTGLDHRTEVRLCLRTSQPPSAVTLNGAELPKVAEIGCRRAKDSVVPNQPTCWPVEWLLRPVNRLVVRFSPAASHLAQRSSDSAEGLGLPGAFRGIECFLEIDENVE